MADNDQEKTEQPTLRKREQVREEGRVAVSKELATFFLIFGALVVFYFSGVWMATASAEFMKSSFASMPRELGPKEIMELSWTVSYKFFLIALPVFFIPVFGAAAYVLQNGVMFTGKSLAPDINKINPVEGFKRIFSLNSVAELLKSLVKVFVLGFVVYQAVADEWRNMPFLADAEVTTSLSYIGSVTLKIMWRTVWVLAAIAALDYLFQRWNFERSLRMTKEEVRQEARELEGDPLVKARIKSVQRELARRRMMQDVPSADVVVTNPTHLAVALKYDRNRASAPVVVAKGANLIAQKIRELAREHGVPVVENKPLARALYRDVEIGKAIPAALYRAVAELLAYVYRLKSRVRTN